MAKDRIQIGGTKKFYVAALDAAGDYITGLTDVLLEIRRAADGFYLDFNDMTFKNAGWTTRQQQMTESDATNSPGLYHYDVATTGWDPGSYAARASSATAANGRWQEEVEIVRILDGIVFRGTCGAGGTLNSVILTSAPGPYTDFYVGAFVMMTSGFLAGAVRKITAYDASTKSATVKPNWPLSVSPSSGDTFVILPSAVSSHEVWEATFATYGGVTGTYGRLFKPNDTESFIDSDYGVIITGQPHAAGAQVDLNTTGKASVNAEVVDVLTVDTHAEPGQGAPPATSSILQKIAYLFKWARNRQTFSKATGVHSFFGDDGTTVDQKATDSDDGTTFTKGEIGTGP